MEAKEEVSVKKENPNTHTFSEWNIGIIIAKNREKQVYCDIIVFIFDPELGSYWLDFWFFVPKIPKQPPPQELAPPIDFHDWFFAELQYRILT